MNDPKGHPQSSTSSKSALFDPFLPPPSLSSLLHKGVYLANRLFSPQCRDDIVYGRSLTWLVEMMKEEKNLLICYVIAEVLNFHSKDFPRPLKYLLPKNKIRLVYSQIVHVHCTWQTHSKRGGGAPIADQLALYQPEGQISYLSKYIQNTYLVKNPTFLGSPVVGSINKYWRRLP